MLAPRWPDQPTWGARQLLFLSPVTYRILGRRVKGCPGRVHRCLTRRSSSQRAAARTCGIALAPWGALHSPKAVLIRLTGCPLVIGSRTSPPGSCSCDRRCSSAEECAGNNFPISAWCLGDGSGRVSWHLNGRGRLLGRGASAGSAQWSPRKNFRTGTSYGYMASSDRKLCVVWYKRVPKSAKRPHIVIVAMCGKCALREPTSVADLLPRPTASLA